MSAQPLHYRLTCESQSSLLAERRQSQQAKLSNRNGAIQIPHDGGLVIGHPEQHPELVEFWRVFYGGFDQ